MTSPSRILLVLFLMSVVTSRFAAADMAGSFDGQVTGKKLAQSIPASAAITVQGKTATGTIAVGVPPTPHAGAYIVTGHASAKRLKLAGNLSGARLVWTAKITGDTLTGKILLKGAGAPKLAGVLTLTHNPALPDASACDAVYTQNQTVFIEKVLDDALLACTSCHVPNGQADATRFHVITADGPGTARNVAALVDSANPSASRIIEKPLVLVPHGGAQQIVPGSTQEQELRDWVALVAAAHCN